MPRSAAISAAFRIITPVGRLRIVVDLILRRHRIGRRFRIVVIVGTSRGDAG
jgi:hypothetical protein